MCCPDSLPTCGNQTIASSVSRPHMKALPPPRPSRPIIWMLSVSSQIRRGSVEPPAVLRVSFHTGRALFLRTNCTSFPHSHRVGVTSAYPPPPPPPATGARKKFNLGAWRSSQNMSVIVSRCGTGQCCEVSVCVLQRYGECTRKYPLPE